MGAMSERGAGCRRCPLELCDDEIAVEHFCGHGAETAVLDLKGGVGMNDLKKPVPSGDIK